MASKNNFKNIDEYIALFPVEIQSILQNIRKEIVAIEPNALEVISYRMPAYTLNGKILVYFAAYKKHIGFYPLPLAIVQFKKRLDKYKYSKGAIQFPINKPIPYDLIRDIVNFKKKEICL